MNRAVDIFNRDFVGPALNGHIAFDVRHVRGTVFEIQGHVADWSLMFTSPRLMIDIDTAESCP